MESSMYFAGAAVPQSNMYMCNTSGREYAGPSALLGGTFTWMEELSNCSRQREMFCEQPLFLQDDDLTSTASSSLADSPTADNLGWLDGFMGSLANDTAAQPPSPTSVDDRLQRSCCFAAGGSDPLSCSMSSTSGSVTDVSASSGGVPSPQQAQSCFTVDFSEPRRNSHEKELASPELPQGVLKRLLAQNRSPCASPGNVSPTAEAGDRWHAVPAMPMATPPVVGCVRLSHFAVPVPSTPERSVSPPEVQWRMSETVCKKHKRLRQTRRRPERSLITGKRKFRCETCTGILEEHARKFGSKLRPQDREELLKKVGMSLQQLDFWFSNRRRSDKQQQNNARLRA